MIKLGNIEPCASAAKVKKELKETLAQVDEKQIIIDHLDRGLQACEKAFSEQAEPEEPPESADDEESADQRYGIGEEDFDKEAHTVSIRHALLSAEKDIVRADLSPSEHRQRYWEVLAEHLHPLLDFFDNLIDKSVEQNNQRWQEKITIREQDLNDQIADRDADIKQLRERIDKLLYDNDDKSKPTFDRAFGAGSSSPPQEEVGFDNYQSIRSEDPIEEEVMGEPQFRNPEAAQTEEAETEPETEPTVTETDEPTPTDTDAESDDDREGEEDLGGSPELQEAIDAAMEELNNPSSDDNAPEAESEDEPENEQEAETSAEAEEAPLDAAIATEDGPSLEEAPENSESVEDLSLTSEFNDEAKQAEIEQLKQALEKTRQNRQMLIQANNNFASIIDFTRQLLEARQIPIIAKVLVEFLEQAGIPGAIRISGFDKKVTRVTDGMDPGKARKSFNMPIVTDGFIESNGLSRIGYKHIQISLGNMDKMDTGTRDNIREIIPILGNLSNQVISSMNNEQTIDSQRNRLKQTLVAVHQSARNIELRMKLFIKESAKVSDQLHKRLRSEANKVIEDPVDQDMFTNTLTDVFSISEKIVTRHRPTNLVQELLNSVDPIIKEIQEGD